MTDYLKEISSQVKHVNEMMINKGTRKTWEQSLREIDAAVQLGESKLGEYRLAASTALAHTAKKGQLLIEDDAKDVDAKWAELRQSVGLMKERLTTTSENLATFDGCCDKFDDWIKAQEGRAKSFVPVVTLEEKRSNVIALQVDFNFNCCCLTFIIHFVVLASL